MEQPHSKHIERPEAKIQRAIMDMMTLRGWWCKQTHGNAYTEGWPDFFSCHYSYGQRWVEVKLPNMKGSHFTSAQLRDFLEFMAHGSGVWILTAASEGEYQKLFEPPNWWKYLDVMK